MNKRWKCYELSKWEGSKRKKTYFVSWKLLFFLPILFFFGYSFAFPIQKLIIILVFYWKIKQFKSIFMKKFDIQLLRTTFENRQFSHLQELFYLWEPFSFELDKFIIYLKKLKPWTFLLNGKKIIQKNPVGS